MALRGVEEDEQNNETAIRNVLYRSESRLGSERKSEEQEQSQQDEDNNGNQPTDRRDEERQSGQLEACVLLIVPSGSDPLSSSCLSC